MIWLLASQIGIASMCGDIPCKRLSIILYLDRFTTFTVYLDIVYIYIHSIYIPRKFKTLMCCTAVSLMQRWSMLLKEKDKERANQALEAILGWL
jgi:hypothetical protein